MPERTFMNPFQLFPMTLLLHFGPCLCPEVLRRKQCMESQEAEHGLKKKITLAVQRFPLATSSKQGRKEMWFSLDIVGLN